MSVLRWSAALALAASALVPTAAAAEEVPSGLEGSGTASDPYRIGSQADLVRWAELLNAADPAYTGTKVFRVTKDIALTGTNTVPMVRDFDGTLDGAGHTISGYTAELALPASNPGGFRAGFILRNDGTVRNLTLDDLEVTCTGDNGTATGPACAGLVADNYGTLVTSAVYGTVTAPGMEKVAGIAAANFGGTIRDVAFTGAATASFMPGGIVSYANNSATIERAVVDADLVATSTKPTAGRTNQQGNDGGLVAAYPNNVTMRNNVATGGSITYAYPGVTPGFFGRISGYDGFSRTLSGNHAYADILINGVAVTGTATNQQGQNADAATLRDPAFYASLGFDLETVWQLDAGTGLPVLRDPVVVEPIPPLAGAGTAQDPYLIGTEDEFHRWSALVNDATNPDHTGVRYYRITADIALTRPFTMVNQFRGNLDGTGHTVSGLVVTGDLSTRNLVAMVGENSGVIENLVLDGADVTMTGNRGPITGPTAAALVARNATGGLVQSVAVTGTVEAPGAEKAAGLVGENLGGVIKDCSFEGDVTGNLLAAGVAAYNNGNGSVQRCLIDADLTTLSTQPVQGRDEQRGNDAAFMIAYPNTGSVQSSVAYGGSISYAYPGVTPGFYGRISGYDGFSRLLRDNLANAAITINGATVTGQAASQHGADRTAAQLADRATYENLGWDFGYTWGWDAERSRPVLSYADTSMRPDRVTVTFNGDARTRRGFTWYTRDAAAQPVVRLSTSPDLTDAVEIPAQPLARAGAFRFQAVAEGLTPGATYYYRVGDAASGNTSPTGTFRTAGSADDDGFSFVALTDTQSQSEAEALISAETMAKSLTTVPDAAFMLHSGDVVETGTNESMWQDLLNLGSGALMNTTFAPTSGNHDAGGNAFVEHFNVERNGNTTDGSYYSYDYGKAHFAVLNSNDDAAQAVSPAQLAWLRADVTAARERGAEWVFVNLHKGPYTTAVHVDDPEVVRLRETLVPLMDELEVDLVFQGHDHIYARTRVLDYDPEGIAKARVAETSRYTELVGGKRIEYTLDAEGIRYLLTNTAGAKHYDQNTNPNGLDMDAYLGLFERSDQGRTTSAAERNAQYFAEVSIEGGKLEVVMYQIKDRAQPFALEGFGIDRDVQPVIDTIAALPEPEQATAADRSAVAAARTAFDGLTRGQRSAVSNAARLAELERVLATADGAVPWHVDGAEARQSIAVRNSTDSDVADAPVLLRLTDVPDGTEAGALQLLDAVGHPVPFEVEHWDPAGTTTVWARVARVAAGSATNLWAYYGVPASANDPADVWRGDHLLVEHFGRSAAAGSELTDSTGISTGTVEGAGLVASTGPDGTRTADFAGTKISYGDVGSGLDQITVSAVVTVAGDQAENLAAIVAKDLLGDGTNDTFGLSLRESDRRLLAAHVGTWYESSATTRRASEGSTAWPADGEPHLVTLTYDGMTFAAYVDGELIHQNFAEYRTTLSDPDTPTTIGAFSDPGIIRGAFTGTLDEVQLTGNRTSPALEEFRYAAWFGDALGYGGLETRGDGVGLTVSYPLAGAAVDAGPVIVSGVVTHDATLGATVDGQTFDLGEIAAGEFRVEVPVYAAGSQTVELTADAVESDASARAEVALEVSDEAAPAQPELSDTAVDGIVAIGHDEAELSADVEAGEGERTTVQFMRSQSVSLGGDQVKMRSGTTPATLPTDLPPTAGTASAEPYTVTTGENVTPYQIFDVALTAAQARAQSYRLTWTGSAEREVTGYYWDHAADAWAKAGTAYGPDGAETSMDIVVPRAGLNGRTVTVLLWRGLGSALAGRSSYVPGEGQFDFSYALIPDTQLYTQSYPELITQQTRYIADHATENKTVMALQLGDLVNRPWLSEEYQWYAADTAMDVLDDARVPYAIAWGNHDYDNDSNNRRMYEKYFPAERLQESVGDMWGDSRGIDNAYYLMEQDGAKIMVVTVGYFGSNEDLAWVADAIRTHPDHSVIIVTHSYTGTPGGLSGEGGRLRTALVAPFPNVKMILSGHVSGVGLHYESIGGRPVWGVLQDYQGMPFGGLGFLRNMKVDVENDLVYFNTYSPYTGETTSPYGNRQMTVPGTYHQTNADNFVIPVDFGGTSSRSLTTSSLLLATAEDVPLGAPVSLTGPGTATLDLAAGVLDLKPRTTVRWYAILTDVAGNRTVTGQRVFALERYRPGLPRG